MPVLRCLMTLAVALAIVHSSSGRLAIGADFRIDTEIFVGKEKEPKAETLTLFAGGLVYDFLLTEPQEVTLLDTQRGRFTLLDPSRKLKAGLSTQEVLDYVLALDSHAVESKKPLFVFAATPKFEFAEKEIQQNGQKLIELMLTGAPLEYHAQGRAEEQTGASAAYRSFADWHARLNALRPGNLPPGARLELNKALAERTLLPLEVTRIIPASNPLGKTLEVRSRHLVNWRLSGEDRKKIDRAGTWLADFRQVTFDEYRSGGAAATVKTAQR